MLQILSSAQQHGPSTSDHCLDIPSDRSDHVVTTLTDYNPSFENDEIDA